MAMKRPTRKSVRMMELLYFILERGEFPDAVSAVMRLKVGAGWCAVESLVCGLCVWWVGAACILSADGRLLRGLEKL